MNYLMLLEQLRDYYSNLLIVQYNGKPKAVATIKLYVDLLFSTVILLQVRDAFDWRTAIGNQLDIIGKWVGVDRYYIGNLYELQPWFALIDWEDTGDNLQGGFSTFDTFNSEDGGIIDYSSLDIIFGTLKDTNFRTLVGLKIIKNNINHTCKTIDNAIWNYFNGKAYTTWDLEKRTLTYSYNPEINGIINVAYKKNVLPCPPTVSIKLQEIITNG